MGSFRRLSLNSSLKTSMRSRKRDGWDGEVIKTVGETRGAVVRLFHRKLSGISACHNQ